MPTIAPTPSAIGFSSSRCLPASAARIASPALTNIRLELEGGMSASLEPLWKDQIGGADSFITNVPWALDLCRRIGFDRQLVRTEKGRRQASVVRRGKLLAALQEIGADGGDGRVARGGHAGAGGAVAQLIQGMDAVEARASQMKPGVCTVMRSTETVSLASPWNGVMRRPSTVTVSLRNFGS